MNITDKILYAFIFLLCILFILMGIIAIFGGTKFILFAFFGIVIGIFGIGFTRHEIKYGYGK